MRLRKEKSVSHFSLLKAKGRASFSLASRSESDSLRLKVKLVVGSLWKNRNSFLSWVISESYLLMVCMYLKCVHYHLLFLCVSPFKSKLAALALYHNSKIVFDAENLFLE